MCIQLRGPDHPGLAGRDWVQAAPSQGWVDGGHPSGPPVCSAGATHREGWGLRGSYKLMALGRVRITPAGSGASRPCHHVGWGPAVALCHTQPAGRGEGGPAPAALTQTGAWGRSTFPVGNSELPPAAAAGKGRLSHLCGDRVPSAPPTAATPSPPPGPIANCRPSWPSLATRKEGGKGGVELPSPRPGHDRALALEGGDPPTVQSRKGPVEGTALEEGPVGWLRPEHPPSTLHSTSPPRRHCHVPRPERARQRLSLHALTNGPRWAFSARPRWVQPR